MQRLLLPLCLLGLLLAGFPFRSSAFFNDLHVLEHDFRRSASEDMIESLLRDTAPRGTATHFTDIQPGSWYAPSVELLSAWGLISGYTDIHGNRTNTFGPTDSITVAQMLKMALTASYGDIDSCPSMWVEHIDTVWMQHWAAPYLRCGLGISMRVLRDEHLDVDRPATRAEVLAIIHDAFITTVPPLYSTFRDTEGHPYEADIAYAAARRVVEGDTLNGVPTNFFRPDALVQRAEAAKMFYETLRADFEQSPAGD